MPARKAQRPEVLVATATFAYDEDGRMVVVQAGTKVQAGHPATKDREDLFVPDGADVLAHEVVKAGK